MLKMCYVIDRHSSGAQKERLFEKLNVGGGGEYRCVQYEEFGRKRS